MTIRRRTAVAIGLAVLLQCALPAIASRADDHDWHGREHWEHHHRGWEHPPARRYYRPRYYYAPRPEVYYYQPPPVYVVPPPPPPSIGFDLIFPFHFH